MMVTCVMKTTISRQSIGVYIKYDIMVLKFRIQTFKSFWMKVFINREKVEKIFMLGCMAMELHLWLRIRLPFVCSFDFAWKCKGYSEQWSQTNKCDLLAAYIFVKITMIRAKKKKEKKEYQRESFKKGSLTSFIYLKMVYAVHIMRQYAI